MCLTSRKYLNLVTFATPPRVSRIDRYMSQHLTAGSRALNSQNSRSYDVLSTRHPQCSGDEVTAVVEELVVMEAVMLKEKVAIGRT